MYYERYLTEVYMNSGWASNAELTHTQGCVQGNLHSRPAEGGVVLYNNNGTIFADGSDECRHVLVVGATGTGKSRLVILPSLLYSLSAKKKRSYVVFDVKGELQKYSRNIAEANGYDILNINFRCPDESDSWNPFYKANALYRTGKQENRRKAVKLLEDIIASVFRDGECTKTDPFWRTSSAELFRGICTVIWEMGENLSVSRILELSDGIPADKDDDSGCQLFRLAKRVEDLKTGKRLFGGFQMGSNITRGNVLACYRGYLSPLASRDDVVRMISGNDTKAIDFAQLGTRPTVLYVTLPDDTSALGTLQGILLNQLMQELNEGANNNGGCLSTRVDMYLDEVCNIQPAISSLASALTIARSRGIRYILAIQSYAQLCSIYGESAETITANCSTWIVFNVSKDETFRDRLSRLCGNNPAGKPLIKPSELALLPYGSAIVIRERMRPYYTQLEDVGDMIARTLYLPKDEGTFDLRRAA